MFRSQMPSFSTIETFERWIQIKVMTEKRFKTSNSNKSRKEGTCAFHSELGGRFAPFQFQNFGTLGRFGPGGVEAARGTERELCARPRARQNFEILF